MEDTDNNFDLSAAHEEGFKEGCEESKLEIQSLQKQLEEAKDTLKHRAEIISAYQKRQNENQSKLAETEQRLEKAKEKVALILADYPDKRIDDLYGELDEILESLKTPQSQDKDTDKGEADGN